MLMIKVYKEFCGVCGDGGISVKPGYSICIKRSSENVNISGELVMEPSKGHMQLSVCHTNFDKIMTDFTEF